MRSHPPKSIASEFFTGDFVFGGFRNKNRAFIDALKFGIDTCSSPFRDILKTMRVCHTIFGAGTHRRRN